MAQRAVAETPVAQGMTRPARPVDLVHLTKQCLGDENLELEILRLFDTTLTTYFGRLKLASSFDDLAINLHSIKGSAAGVGAWGIVDIAKACEADLRAGRPLRAERIDDLGIAVEEVRVFVTRMLAGVDD
ncbi:Hpt domain-containing protein [Devosia chinhatensis]|uniref:HPt domain-containing protein n=1 Tax=Devosia chinhatensis TaxID=429727 RepID=A0A0F5FP07_9HYPH|nr:Hpt domain-containing protein [Devosia chinhatensis]KKB09932.1 hypothetical protein VE26_08955 [Devosia chinhatensis]